MRTALLLLATVAVGTRAQWSTVCDSVRLNKCLNDVFSDGQYGLNITTDATVLGNIMRDYTILNNWFLSQWGRDDGIDTIVKNCNALTNFYHCLGGPACFSMENMLTDDSTTKYMAYAVRGVLAEYNFNCGTGLGTMLAGNIKCIQNVVASSQDYLKGCTSTYLNNVQHDQPRACNYGHELVACYMAPFHLAECRQEQDTDKWWACTSQKEFIVPQFGYCFDEIVCEENPGVAAHLAAFHTQNADGSHTLRLPDLVQLSKGQVTKVQGRSFTLKL